MTHPPHDDGSWIDKYVSGGQKSDSSGDDGSWIDRYVGGGDKGGPASASQSIGADQGFFSYTGNLAKNWFKTAAVYERLGTDPSKDPQFTDPEMIRIRNAIRLSQARGSGANIAFSDYMHFFGKMFENTKDQIQAAVQHGKLPSPSDLAKGFEQPIADTGELLYGVHLTEDQVSALTPAEKSERIKRMAALGVATAVGMGAAKALGLRAGMTLEDLNKLDPNALEGVSHLSPIGAVAKRVMKTGAVGGLSGVAYGLTAKANESDQLTEALTDGVMFGSIGGAADLLLEGRKTVKTTRDLARSASDIQQIRHLQSLDQSMSEAIHTTEALTTANDIAEAILTGKMGSNRPIIVPGVDPSRIGTLTDKVPEHLRTAIFTRPDGSADLLVHDGTVDEKFFGETGLIKGGKVSYEGAEYTVHSLDQKGNIVLSTGLLDHTQVKDADGRPLRVFHGTRSVFSDFDMRKANPDALLGPALYHTADVVDEYGEAEIAGGYAGNVSGIEAGIGDLHKQIEYVDSQIKMFQDRIDTGDPRSEAERNQWKVSEGIFQYKEQIRLLQKHRGQIEQMLEDYKNMRPNIRPAKLDIRNPFYIDEVYHTPERHNEVMNRLVEAAKRLGSTPEQVARFVNRMKFDAESEVNGWSLYKNLGEFSTAEEATKAKANKILQEAGFDGITHEGGKRTGHLSHQVWIAFKPEQVYPFWAGEIVLPKESLRNIVGETQPWTRDVAINKTYADWRAALEKEMVDQSDLRAKPDPQTHPIGFDETPPDFLDRLPAFNFDEHLDKFLASKGFSFKEQKVLKQEFMKKILNESAMQLPPEEKELITQASKTHAEHVVSNARETNSMRKLDRLARSNHMRIEDTGTRIIIRDSGKGHRILSWFDDADKAAEWINRTGQADGPQLDNNSAGISLGGGSIPLPPDNGKPPIGGGFPHDWWSRGKKAASGSVSERFLRALDNIPILTRKRDFFQKVDTDNGTNIWRDVFEPTQTAKATRDQLAAPYAKRLDEVADALKGLSWKDRETVSRWIETMSPDQVRTRGGARPMNLTEVQYAQAFFRRNIDLTRVFDYTREREKLAKEYEGKDDPQSQTEHDQRLFEAKQAYGIDENHEWAADQFDNIRKMKMDAASLGLITRLTRALQNEDVTREQFAAAHKMTAQQIRAGNVIEKLYADLAKVFDIPEAQRLGGYMTHARLYYDGNLGKAIREDFSGDTKAKDFYAKMTRTGEVDAFERDPLIALQRYIKSGFDVKSGWRQALANAENALKSEVDRLPPGKQQMVMNVGRDYLDRIKGFPAAADTFAQEAVAETLKEFGVTHEPDVRHQWVDGILSTMHFSMIGLRPVMGYLHFHFASALSIADRGLGYTGRMLKQGAYARSHPEVLELVKNQGGFSTISPISILSKEEFEAQSRASTKLVKAAETASEAAFKTTLLPDVFEMLSAGHFLASKADALHALTRYGREEISWRQVEKETHLLRHNEPVVRRFKDLVKAKQYEEASRILAVETVNDLLGRFGNGNEPYLWGTNFGRLAGQYGQWPRWVVSTMARGLSRGTVGQRLGFAAKMYAISWASQRVARSLGIDPSRFSVMEAMSWAGGPLEQLGENLSAWFHGEGYPSEAGKRRVLQVLPWQTDQWGNVHPRPSMFLPGSFAIDNIIQGVKDVQENPVQGLWEMGGGRKLKDARSRYGFQ